MTKNSIKLLVAAGTLSCLPALASLTFVTTPGALGANDSVNWSQLGGDQTQVSNNFSALSGLGLSVTGSFAGSPNDGLVAVVCPPSAGTCSWDTSGTGINANDSLLWAFDNNTSVGTGGMTFVLGSARLGVGAWVQADTIGQYTLQLQLFNGATSLGTSTVTSDASGDPVFFGAFDSTSDVTKAVFSLTSCAGCGGGLGDFAIDSLMIKAAAAVTTPEPSSVLLLGAGLAAISWRVRKNSLKNRRNS